MSAGTRAGLFLVALGLAFGGAFGVGRLFDDEEPAYRLVLASTNVNAGASVPFSFRIEDGDGKPLTAFARRHEKRLHLIAVGHRFGGFQHVHPTMAADGTWTTELALGQGGWRIYADFVPSGEGNEVRYADLDIPLTRPVAPSVQPAEGSSAGVDGFRVTPVGELVAGDAGTMLELRVTRNGTPVTDLQPYLGAYGHLVVLRESDMKYLHVHPEAGPAGPGIPFHVEVPTAGRYHLYLDFKDGGVVRTAHLVLNAAQAPDNGHDEGGMVHGDH